MRFSLIDKIINLQPGNRITAIKGLSLSEDYLQDHFPLFPVMPGALMLESMYQTSAWLVRKTDDFAHSMVTLKEARNVKYADFVEPGQILSVTAEIQKRDDRLTWLKASGTVDGAVAVQARLVLDRFNLADEREEELETDAYARSKLRAQFQLLFHPTSSLDAVS